MAQYSLFVLKMPLNTKQLTNAYLDLRESLVPPGRASEQYCSSVYG